MPTVFPQPQDSRELLKSRRAIVVMDLVESVRLGELLGDQFITRWQDLIQQVREKVLPRHGGKLVKSIGDGMLLLFDSVSQAVLAVTAIQEAVAENNRGQPRLALFVLRFGLHAGPVVEADIDAFGSAVNLAARLVGLAADGGFIVSAEASAELVPGYDADMEDLGEHDLKGITHPVRAFRLGPAPAAPLSGWAEPLRSRVALMVAPFDGDADTVDPVLRLLVSDNLVQQLSRQPYWRVISSLSARALAARGPHTLDLARAAGAHYVVTGHCGLLAGALVVAYEVAEASDGALLYAGRVHGSPQALLALDDPFSAEMLAQVAQAVLAAEVRRVATHPLPSLQSYSVLFGSIALMHRMSRADFARAFELLTYLCERHPRAPEARAWLGKWHVLNIVQGWTHDVDSSASLGHAQVQRALDHDPDHALALAIDGLIEVLLRDNLALAERRYDAALAANPNEAYAHLFRSALMAYTGRGEQAVESARLALSLSPLDPNRYFFDSFMAHAWLAAGDHAAAAMAAKASVRLNAAHLPTWRTLAIAAQLAGQHEQARQAVARLRALQPDYTVEKFLQRYPGRQAAGTQDHARALADAGLPRTAG